MNVLGCVCPSGAFPWGSPSLGLFSPSQRQKVSNPKNGAVHLPAPAHRHVDTVHTSVPCCIGLQNESMQLNSTAVTAFDCLKNTLPTTRCGVLHPVDQAINDRRLNSAGCAATPRTARFQSKIALLKLKNVNSSLKRSERAHWTAVHWLLARQERVGDFFSSLHFPPSPSRGRPWLRTRTGPHSSTNHRNPACRANQKALQVARHKALFSCFFFKKETIISCS